MQAITVLGQGPLKTTDSRPHHQVITFQRDRDHKFIQKNLDWVFFSSFNHGNKNGSRIIFAGLFAR